MNEIPSTFTQTCSTAKTVLKLNREDKMRKMATIEKSNLDRGKLAQLFLKASDRYFGEKEAHMVTKAEKEAIEDEYEKTLEELAKEIEDHRESRRRIEELENGNNDEEVTTREQALDAEDMGLINHEMLRQNKKKADEARERKRAEMRAKRERITRRR